MDSLNRSRRRGMSRARVVAPLVSLSLFSLVSAWMGSWALVSAAPAAAQRADTRGARYEIRFHRPSAVGARARIEVEGSKQMTMERRAGRATETVRDDTTQVRFVAVERVVAVNASAKPTTLEYTIEAFEVTHAGTRSTPLPAGTVLTVERATQPGTEPHLRVNGREVSEEVASALAIVITRRTSETNDDDVFGSSTPRRVGERWNVNAALAQQELARGGAPEMRLRGDVRATGLTTIDSVECLELRVSMRGQLSGIPNMPPQATFRSGTMELSVEGALPTDGTSRARRGGISMTLDVTFSVPGATPRDTQRFHMVVRESRQERATPLP